APWFFNHQQVPFPIGSHKRDARDPDCPLDLFLLPEKTVARCWFNQATKEAEIVYDLVKLGHLAATSVGFLGLESKMLDREKSFEFGSPHPVRVWERWEYVESSIVGVGANREALTVHLQRGRIGGRALTDTVKKWLEPYALPSKTWANGWT